MSNYTIFAQLDDVNILKEFENLDLLMDILNQFNFSEKQCDKIFGELKLILELLNCANKSELDTTLSGMLDILHILGIGRIELTNQLTNKVFEVNNERIVKKLSNTEICINIRSFCEDIYERLFDYIINHIGLSLGKTSDRYISILDIFGFEIFDVNGYEQLCINYTNELLQSIFNQYIFENEQSEYNRENIKWNDVKYIQNDNIISLFSDKVSIFSIRLSVIF